MAEEEKPLTTDERVQRSVGRTLSNGLLLIVVLVALGLWLWTGSYYELRPGEAAVVLRLGAHARTVEQAGPHFHIPYPFERIVVLNVDEVRKQEFGFRGREDADVARPKLLEASMQTGDNNIVRVSFAVQYRYKDAFQARFRVANPEPVVRDAAQAAMREVVGRETVDGVLRDRRDLVTAEASELLQEILDSYEAGILIKDVQLLDVQPPAPVRAAFDDVVAANQDASRVVNEAEAYRNELIPKARAEATELLEAAYGYREAVAAEATGEAERFRAVSVEYRRAPEVTKKRMYLETMELVLPKVDKIIIEGGTTQVLPYLPLGKRSGGAQ